MGVAGEPRAWPLPGLKGPRAGLWSALIVLALLASRLLFFPDGPWEQDEAIFAAGVLDTDVTRHRPHPPGFPGWMLLGKALLPLVGDPLLTLRILSSVLSVAMVVWLAASLKPLARGWATVGAVVVALLPGVWVHAPRAFATTPALAFFVLAALAWWRGFRVAGWVSLALGVAVRPQLVVLAPLLIPLALVGASRRQSALGIVAAIVVGAMAFGWIVHVSGGWEPYLASTQAHLDGHMTRGTRASLALADLGIVRAAGGVPGATALVLLWCVGVVDLRRRSGPAVVWSLVALPVTIAYVVLLHHPGFPRYSVPVFLVMAPGLARGLKAFGKPATVVGAAGLVGWSAGQTVPALLAMASAPLPPEAALRELATGEGPIVYSHGQFAFVRLATATGHLTRPVADASRPGELRLDRSYTVLGAPGDVLPGVTVGRSVVEGIPRGAWDLSQRRYDRVEVVRHPVWLASGASAADRDRLGQRFRWLGTEVGLRPQPGAERMVLVLTVDEGEARSLMARAGGARKGAALTEGVTELEIPLTACGHDCQVDLSIGDVSGSGRSAGLVRLYGAWCEGPDFEPAPFRVTPGRPLEARAHGVGFVGVEEPERFTADERPGAWTVGRAMVVVPVDAGTVELVLAQPPPRGPTVEIVTGAGVHRVRAGADPVRVRVELGGSREIEIRSGTRTPASYSEGNPDDRQLGAILFEVAWDPR